MNRSNLGVPHLSKAWDGITMRIRASRRIVVFLDFDGTLVRIVARPNLVRLSPKIRETLKRLVRNPRVTLAVVSGRRRVEIQRYVGVAGIHYFGLYGWERGEAVRLPDAVRKALPLAWGQLSQHLYDYPSAWIENKRNSLSVHLLKIPQRLQSRVRREVRVVLRPFERNLRVFENLRDMEIVPLSIRGKGAAGRDFLAKPSFRGALPFYFGDDLSDEPAFNAVRKGISVVVGRRRGTHAQYHLRGPAEVGATLAKLKGALS
jgi:trehalose 6-phosphate phosphatase